MTTQYKQALDDLYLTGLEDWSRENMPIILRALLIADAVYGEALTKCRPIRDRTNGVYSSESYRVDGWNNCLEHLRKIGAGE